MQEKESLPDKSDESQQMRIQIQSYQLSHDWNLPNEESNVKFQLELPLTNQKIQDKKICYPQSIYEWSISKQYFQPKQEFPFEHQIQLQGKPALRCKVSTIKTVLRSFYRQVKEKISEKEVKNEWKLVMRKNYQQKYKRKTFKYNIASMDHLFCEGNGLPETIVKQNRDVLVKLLKSQQFRTKIRESMHFAQEKRLKYLSEVKVIIWKCQLPVKSFAQGMKK